MRKISYFCIAAVLQLTTAAWPDTLILRDGRRYDGTFVNGSSREVTFQDETGARRRYSTSDVHSVEFQPSAVSRTPRYRRGAAASTETRTIPAGTDLVVRTNEEINTRTASEGRTYSAIVERDVIDSTGAVAVPRGSEAQLVVREVDTGGAVGTAEVALDLQSVAVGSQRYLVSTAEVERRGEGGLGRNRRTAEMVGGGALLGTLLGAIAGGGRGAAIGAIAGAGAGAAVQVLTRGKEVRVPAESVLTFRLDQAVRLEAMRR